MELNVDLVSLVQSEGVDLKKRGQVHFGLCPFHEDKNPSFAAYESSKRFVCFGCGEKGDAIDFVKKLKNLTFKEALSYLAIDNSNKAKEKVSPELNKRSLITSFRKWVTDYYNEVSTDYRVFNTVIRNFSTMEEAEQFALLYHQLPIWEYQLDILLFGNDQEKYELFEEVMF